MSEGYASKKQKMLFDKQQIKPSVSRRWVFAFCVALLASQTFLYSLGMPMISGYSGNQSVPLPPLVETEEGQHHEPAKEPVGHEEGMTPSTTESTALSNDRKNGLLILVNKQHAVDKDYKPADLTAIKYYAQDRSPNARYMRAEAAEAFNKMSEAAAKEGYTIVVTTAYRSYDFQKYLYDNYVKKSGQAAADRFSAQPGKSEHQTGLSADVSSPSVGYQLTKDYINTPEGKWLNDNAHKFGFIIRFPQGKEDITGYMYEPWHVRYVGCTAAEEIYNRGITLEEYLES